MRHLFCFHLISTYSKDDVMHTFIGGTAGFVYIAGVLLLEIIFMYLRCHNIRRTRLALTVSYNGNISYLFCEWKKPTFNSWLFAFQDVLQAPALVPYSIDIQCEKLISSLYCSSVIFSNTWLALKWPVKSYNIYNNNNRNDKSYDVHCRQYEYYNIITANIP